ncbi:MAG: hypothetical protein P8P98_06230 [Emcibacteraceae bacterium]|nr:hypothetical protein [Emcibacteraceae bacterium]MDG1996988.1 hypothetical protein [Emcibacteraceae bacterium]
MKLIFVAFVGFSALLLSSCGTIMTNCSTLTDDRNAYRNCMAVQGDIVSQYDMGMIAFEAKDYETAIHWFKRASKPKNGRNMPDYASPAGIDKYSPMYARKEFPMVPGHRGAQRMLVEIYEKGIGVTADEKTAAMYRDMINS